MASRFEFSPRVLAKAVTVSTNKTVRNVSRQYVSMVKREISRPFPPASEPGEFPKRRTGDLRDSMDFELVGNGHSRMGSDDPKSRWLELGTSTMLPRPFLRPVLLKLASQHGLQTRLIAKF